jgi:uncharacterized protein (TIGR02246 family)
MTASQVIDVVRAFIAAINRQDLADMSNLMAAEHTFVDSEGATVSGREQMMEAWKAFFGMFPDYRIEVEAVLSAGDVVAVFGSASGTYAGTRGPVAENHIKMLAAWRAAVTGGTVTSWQVYADWTEGHRIIRQDRRKRPRSATADGAKRPR